MIFPTIKLAIVPSITSFGVAFLAGMGLGIDDFGSLLAWQLFGAGGCFIGLYTRRTAVKKSRIWAIFIISQIISFAVFSQDFTDVLFLDKISRPLLSLFIGVLCADPVKAKNLVFGWIGYGGKK